MQVVQLVALINTCGIDHLDRMKEVYPGGRMILNFNAFKDRPYGVIGTKM